jgi:hypothetical protein
MNCEVAVFRDVMFLHFGLSRLIDFLVIALDRLSDRIKIMTVTLREMPGRFPELWRLWRQGRRKSEGMERDYRKFPINGPLDASGRACALS